MEGPEPQTVWNILVGAFIALLGSIGAVYRGKVDNLERDLAALVASCVSRSDLKADLLQIAEARKEMHAENTRKLERIEDGSKEMHAEQTRQFERIADGLRRVHERIDQIPVRSAASRTRSTD